MSQTDSTDYSELIKSLEEADLEDEWDLVTDKLHWKAYDIARDMALKMGYDFFGAMDDITRDTLIPLIKKRFWKSRMRDTVYVAYGDTPAGVWQRACASEVVMKTALIEVMRKRGVAFSDGDDFDIEQ